MLRGIKPGQTQQVVASSAGEHGGVGGHWVLPTHVRLHCNRIPAQVQTHSVEDI
jgi:hypothetical protein